MNYPAGAFQELCRLEDQHTQFIKAQAQAKQLRTQELRESAATRKQVKWVDDLGRDHFGTPESFVVENMPDELIAEAVNAYLCGKDGVAAILFKSACEVGFERGVEFLADVDAERGE